MVELNSSKLRRVQSEARLLLRLLCRLRCSVDVVLYAADVECDDVLISAQSLKDRGDAYDCSNQLTSDIASKLLFRVKFVICQL